MMRNILRVAISLSIVLVAIFQSPLTVNAQCPTTLNVDITSGPYLLVDSNKPGIEGPMVVTVSAVVENTGGSTTEKVYVYIGDGTTPGSFPTGSDPTHSLSMVGSINDATRYIGDLASGESKTIFWQIAYPATYLKTYPFTVWTDNEEGCVAQDSFTFTTRSALSASANKVLGVFTFSPPGGIVYPGNVVTVTNTNFNLGRVGAGPSGEGDVWLQPVGNLDFDPSCFRLVKTEVHLQSISPTVYTNQLYFSNINSQNPPPNYTYNPTDYVKYYFIALSPCNTVVKPYQEVASGTQEKYSGDYSKTAATLTLTSESGGISLSKDVNPETATAGGTLTWTIAYENTTSYPIGDPESGSGLVIIDESIPENTTYVAGSAASSQSTTISFSIDNGGTWTTTEPPAAQVTTIKWHVNEAIPANTTPAGTVSFQSTVNAGVLPGVTICNTALASIGEATILATSSVCANVGTPQVAAEKTDSLFIDADSNGFPSPGDTIRYTVLISNSGTEVARNLVFTDSPGADTNLVVGSVNPTGDSICLITSGNDPGDSSISINVGDLAPQKSVSIYFNVLINNTACGDVANQGWVNGSNFTGFKTNDPDTPSSADPTVTTLNIPSATLNITKAGPDSAGVDSIIAYTGTLSNTGKSTAYNVILTDYLPADVTFTGSSHTAVYDSLTNTVTWQLGNMPPGSSIPGWLNAHISSSVADNTVLVNTFSVSWEDCLGNASGPAEVQNETTVNTHPQLIIDKTGTEESYPGDILNYTIRIENSGGMAAKNVTLTDILPVGLSYVSSNPSGSYNGSAVTWDIGTVAHGAVVLVSLTVHVDNDVPCGTTLTNEAEVKWQDESSTPYGPVNDSHDTTIKTTPQLTITKLGPLTTATDSTITYTGTLSNVSNSTAYAVVLTDELPEGLAFVSSSHAAVYNFSNHTVSWELGNLGPGSSIPGWLTVYVSPSVPEDSVLTNMFSVEWKDDASNSYGPATASWNTTAHESIFEIIKNGPPYASPGDTIEYTIQVTNLGTYDEVSNVILRDLLPSGLTYVSSDPDGTSLNGTVTWSLGPIAVDETVEITIEAEVDSGVGNGIKLTNTAVVTWEYPGGEGQVCNTWDTVIYTQPNLTITKTGPSTAQPGDTFNYTIEICNTGGSDALNVVLTDSLPAGISYSDSSSSGSHTSGTVTWNLGTIEPDICKSILLSVTVDHGVSDGTLLNNIASVIYEDASTNEYGPATTQLGTTIHTRPLMLIMKTGSATAFQGEYIIYNIEVRNLGGSDALNVTITEMLPIELNYVSSNLTAIYDPDVYGEGVVMWELGTIAPGDSQSISVTAAVDYGLYDGTSVLNIASVTWKDSDGNEYGPIASFVSVEIYHTATLDKSGYPGPVTSGETITYSLAYKNVGVIILTGVVVTEIYDSFISFISATPSPDYGTNDHWTIGQLNPGETGEIEITVSVDRDTPDQTVIRNKVYLTADQPLREEAYQKTTTVAAQEPNPSVGGAIIPVNKFQILLPWLGQFGILTATMILLKKRRTQS